jgi:UDP-2-acetamido-2,6-beta-L-arabino-hexul-4-ose reductase
MVRSLKSYKDKRGSLTEVLKGDQVKHVYISTTKPNMERGGHYHKRKTEWFMVIKGLGKLSLVDLKTNERINLMLSGRKPALVKIQPYTCHSIQNIGKSPMYLLVCSNEVFNPSDPDTHELKGEF